VFTKREIFRFDDETVEKLHSVLIAKASAYGKQVAYMKYSPRHNGMTKSDLIRLLIHEEYERMLDNGQIKALLKACPNCGRVDCARGMFCEG
jgi:hypothetical protein